MQKYYVVPAEIIDSNFPEDDLSVYPVIFLPEKSEKEKDFEIIKAMKHYLSNDHKDYPHILENVRKAYDEDGSQPLEDVPDILVWDAVEGRFNVNEFAELVGIS